MPEALTDVQRQTLRELCDTIVPSIRREPDPTGFWARSASDLGVDQAIGTALDLMPPDQRAGLQQLLDAIAEQGFAGASQLSREQLLLNLRLASRDAAFGIGALTSLSLFFAYGIVDEHGQNPNWRVLGYPGPISPAPDVPKPIRPRVPDGDTTIEADAVVVGSGAGGAVIAARLAEAGLRVVVLEAGGYFNEADFNQVELWAHQNLYWRGGPTPTADMNVTLQAGFCVGGGTTVNWTNSLRTKDWVREEWATEHGLEDLATDAFDRHLDAVWQRLQVNDRCSELNRPHQAMKRGADALGWSFAGVTRNWDPSRHDPAMAGYMGFGDQSGAKQSTFKTYLQDAVDRGAKLIAQCWAEGVIVENGRAAGVEATWSDRQTGASARVTVRAPQVVVAAGALESPALLLRSGIGGAATGDHLRLHPCTATVGDYGEDMQAWWGPPHSGLVNEFARGEGEGDGYGFLVEGVQYTTALGASAVPFTTAADHKQAMSEFRNCATFIGLVRDRGHGRVTIDPNGMAVPWYSLEDPRDVATTARALDAQVRLHHAAGARRIYGLAEGQPTWRVGDDLEAFIARLQRLPLRAGGHRLFAAHQMGTCRMGRDPATSVADPRGRLHDVEGVWIGDASAFPTPSGTNPMITIMALASRTAEHVAAAAGASLQEVPA
ncbi:MAG TPA: FAD-dependent oxidoreductase [Solirubrobacteraceae bacterium]|jgi:choline dehydrogenase-like flavoprotein|nr:FAD-dependent oxidoreductase [Solirubrobacteraceae bacterium]